MIYCPECNKPTINRQSFFLAVVGKKLFCDECGAYLKFNISVKRSLVADFVIFIGFAFSLLCGAYYKSWYIFIAVLVLFAILSMLVFIGGGFRVVSKVFIDKKMPNKSLKLDALKSPRAAELKR